MITYLSAFIFYTMAMVGILLVAFIIYKKTIVPAKTDAKSAIKIIDSTPIGAKKNLLIVKVNNEKFLIASGAEHTTFLAKLDDCSSQEVQNYIPETILDTVSKENAVDEKQMKLNEIEKQFKKLYSQDEPAIDYRKEYAQTRRDMVRDLLKELNGVTSAKFEDKF